jgi:four helix bundle protein
VSIPSNLAEGYGRDSTKDFLRFIGMGYGSLMEVQTQLLIAERLGYQSPELNEPLLQAIERTAKILNGLRRSLRRKLEPDKG